MTLLKGQQNVSPYRGMPVKDTGTSSSVTAQSGETIQFVYNSSGTQTNDAGQAAGVIVMAKLKYNQILNVLGDSLAKKGDTSLTFTSSAATSEVNLPSEFIEALDEVNWATKLAAIGAKLITQGQYYVDYAHGVMYINKASTQSTATSGAYSYQGGSGGAGTNASQVQGTAASGATAVGNPVQTGGTFNTTPTTLTNGQVGAYQLDNKGNQIVVGNVASLATDSGSPVKTGGVYNTSAPAPTNGQRVDMQMDSAGNERIAEQFAAQAENNTLNIIQVGTKGVYTRMSSATTTTAKTGAGILHTITINKAVATATITVYDNTAGSGTIIALITFGAALLSDPPLTGIYDVAFATGCTVVTSGATDITISTI